MDWVTRPLAQQRRELFSEMSTQIDTMPGVVERDFCQGDLNKHEDSGWRYCWAGQKCNDNV